MAKNTMSRTEKRLLRLLKSFDDLAADLANIENTSAVDRIRCPLCLEYFYRDAIEDERLTEEHIFPQSVGGRLTTITCRTCNNRHGTRLDSHLAAAAKANDALKGHRAIKSRVEIGNSYFTAEVTFSPDPAVMSEVVAIPEASDQRQIQAAMAALRTGMHEIRFHFSLGYKDPQLWLALLRVAYLNCFHHLGYSYVLSPSVQELRRQIQDDDPPSHLLSSIIASVPLDQRLPSEVHPVHLLDLWSSLSIPAYLTFIQTRLKEVVTYGVLTPCAATRPERSLEQLSEIAGILKGARIKCEW